MFNYVLSAGISGIESYLVRVEADVSEGMPVFELVGYLGVEVREAKERVRTAIKNSGFFFPVKHVTLNLAPGDIRKSKTGYDLAMAIAILITTGQVDDKLVKDTVFIGELTLNGEIKGVEGILPIVLNAKKEKIKRCIVARDNLAEAAIVEEIDIIAPNNLKELASYLNDEIKLSPERVTDILPSDNSSPADFKYVSGQKVIRRGIEVAVSGMHNVLMVGPPGSGKSMIAKCIPTIMPLLSKNESLEVTKIYSVAGKLPGKGGIITERPFISPHHTITDIGMIGGGARIKPGAVSYADRGVLFLDELPEFSRASLEVLRQPLEDGKVTIERNQGSYIYPAEFMLVAAMNPCPCGAYPDRNKCNCSLPAIKRYLSRLSRPLLDRIDICLNVNPLKIEDLFPDKIPTNESSSDIRERVEKTRFIQKKRFGEGGVLFNSKMTAENIKSYCSLGEKEESFLKKSLKKMDISARSCHKILKIARTVADMKEEEKISIASLTEAMHLNKNFEI
ncbi:MAG: YifB family Mg chelatase-like AAA ATPase [Lachnospiraceae bacterium]|nr:YifB family Mg chelatase-like AAA ATPase [Lachnospiraceae bacterium]